MRAELKNITAGKMAKALEKDGFRHTTRRGGHLVYRHSDGRRVVVAFHRSGDTFPVGTLSNILKSTK